MEKKSLLFAFSLMLILSLVSCSGNEPGKSEKSSLPAVARAILRAKVSDAKKILNDSGYYAPSWVNQEDDITYVYPKEVASEDENTQKKALSGSYITLSCHTEGASIINTVWGEQYVPTVAEASNTFNQWLTYLEKTIAAYDLHVVMINKNNDSFVFEEGKLFEDYKMSRLALYEDGYKKGQITKAQLEEEQKRLSVTKDDLQKYLKYLSQNEEYSYYDIYIELINATSNIGVQTMSTFDNYPVENEPDRRMLEHRLQYTNVESMIENLLAMSDQ